MIGLRPKYTAEKKSKINKLIYNKEKLTLFWIYENLKSLEILISFIENFITRVLNTVLKSQ